MSHKTHETNAGESFNGDSSQDQHVNRRGFLQSALGASVAGGIIAATGLPETASAQTGPPSATGIFYKARLVTRICDELRAIDIEADLFVFCLAGGEDPTIVQDQVRAYFERLANEAIEFNRIRGISLEGLRKISFTKDMVPGGVLLEELNEPLFAQLSRKKGQRLMVSVEDASCQCSWCYTGTSEGLERFRSRLPHVG